MTLPRSGDRPPSERKGPGGVAGSRKARTFGGRNQSQALAQALSRYETLSAAELSILGGEADIDSVFDLSRASTPEDARWKAGMAARSFEKTGDPIDALISSCLAGEMGLAPPKNVLKYLASKHRQWLDEEGKRTLDHIMGLSGEKVPAFKRRLLKKRDEILNVDVATLLSLPLKALTGERRLSIEDAAAMVADRLAASDWNKSKWCLDKVGAGRIQKNYSVWPARKRTEEKLKSLTSKWSRKQLRQYLLRFPKKKLPAKLQTFLQD
jgi:hypothetical protein